MIARALWILGVLAIAFVTASVQLDRQSRYTPSWASSVPEPFRGVARDKSTRFVSSGAL